MNIARKTARQVRIREHDAYTRAEAAVIHVAAVGAACRRRNSLIHRRRHPEAADHGLTATDQSRREPEGA